MRVFSKHELLFSDKTLKVQIVSSLTIATLSGPYAGEKDNLQVLLWRMHSANLLMTIAVSQAHIPTKCVTYV